MSQGKDYDLRREILVQDAEGKLPEGIFSEIGAVDWPALSGTPAPLEDETEAAYLSCSSVRPFC